MSYNAFKFNPWDTIQGRWFQYSFKKVVESLIIMLHKIILRKYDKDAYELYDLRLNKDKAMILDFFEEWTEERVQKIISKAVDIFFFMLREDGRYRRLYIILRNKLILEGQIMSLTTAEQEELEKWKGK